MYTCCMYLCIQHSGTAPRCRNHEDGDELLFTPSAVANTSGNVLGRPDFLPNLKDLMHDSAMGVNATTIIDLPRRRLVSSSTGRSRFHTQASRDILFSFRRIRPVFDLRLSPVSPPLQIDQTRGSMGVYRAEQKVGRRTGTAVRG